MRLELWAGSGGYSDSQGQLEVLSQTHPLAERQVPFVPRDLLGCSRPTVSKPWTTASLWNRPSLWAAQFVLSRCCFLNTVCTERCPVQSQLLSSNPAGFASQMSGKTLSRACVCADHIQEAAAQQNRLHCSLQWWFPLCTGPGIRTRVWRWLRPTIVKLATTVDPKKPSPFMWVSWEQCGGTVSAAHSKKGCSTALDLACRLSSGKLCSRPPPLLLLHASSYDFKIVAA